jgi:hypothetical protein
MRRRHWAASAVAIGIAGCAQAPPVSVPVDRVTAEDPMARCIAACKASRCEENSLCDLRCADAARHGRRNERGADEALRIAARRYSARDPEQCGPARGEPTYAPGALEHAYERFALTTRPRPAPSDCPRRPVAERPRHAMCLDPEARTGVTEIAIEHTGCFGSCPIYTLILRADGSADYDGRAFVAHLGRRRGTLRRAEFEELARLALDIGYFDLDAAYTCSVTDSSTVYTSVVRREGNKTNKAMIRHYAPGVTGPPRLRQFEYAIDDTADFVVWK